LNGQQNENCCINKSIIDARHTQHTHIEAGEENKKREEQQAVAQHSTMALACGICCVNPAMSRANKTTKEPGGESRRRKNRAARKNVSSFAYFTAPVLRNDCENRFDGLEGRWHIIFWDSADSPRIYLALRYVRCQLADFLFLSIFFFFLLVCFSFTWREINLKFKCAPSKRGRMSLMMMVTAFAGWEHVFLFGKKV